VRETEGRKRRRVIQWTASLGSLAAIITVVIAAVAYIKVKTAETKESFQQILTARETWKSQFESARRLGQRGEWRKSLEVLEAMDDEFAGDVVAKKLEMVRAYDGLSQAQHGISLLESIENPGPHEADVKLARLAYPALDEAELAKFDGQLQRLLEMKTLSPANAHYVEGLLADSTTGAIAAFRKSLEFDAAHRDARAYLSFLLFLIGEHEEALRAAETGRTLYPLDPRFALDVCIIAALAGDRAKAQVELNSVKRQFDEDTAQLLAVMVEQLSKYEDFLAKALEQNALPDYTSMFLKDLAMWRQLAPRAKNFLSYRLYPFRCVRKMGEAIGLIVSRTFSIFPVGEKQLARDQAVFNALAAGHREGTVNFFAAFFEFKDDEVESGDVGFRRHDALARRLEECVQMKWFIPRSQFVGKAAVLMKLSDMALAVRHGKAPKDFDPRELNRRIRSAIEIADHPPKLGGMTLGILCIASELSGDLVLFRRSAERWAETDRSNHVAQLSLIRAESRLGNSIRVLELLDELQPKLAKGTDLHKSADALRKNAAERLRTAVAKLK
jgi:hypothetical protein